MSIDGVLNHVDKLIHIALDACIHNILCLCIDSDVCAVCHCVLDFLTFIFVVNNRRCIGIFDVSCCVMRYFSVDIKCDGICQILTVVIILRSRIPSIKPGFHICDGDLLIIILDGSRYCLSENKFSAFLNICNLVISKL